MEEDFVVDLHNVEEERQSNNADDNDDGEIAKRVKSRRAEKRKR